MKNSIMNNRNMKWKININNNYISIIKNQKN